jgi:SAM-dependent methyltransferase
MKKLLERLQLRLKPSALSRAECRHALVGPAKLWQMKRNFQIDFLKNSNLQPHHFLADVGCGTLRGGVPLIAYLQYGHYFGVECREEALEEGRKELHEAGLAGKNPTLIWSPDISQLSIDRTFDFVWAFSVLFHMSDDILSDTMSFVSRHLSAEGVFYANVNPDGEEDGVWREFPLTSRPFDFYRNACASHGLTVCDLGPLRELGHISGVEAQDSQRMLRISNR